MKLLLELRRNIYNLVLPSQDVPLRSNEWANMDGTPNKFMNLLLVDRQICQEARSVLYGLNTSTIVISEAHSFLPGRQNTPVFQPVQSETSLGYVKNWQLSLPLSRHAEDGEQNEEVRAAIISSCAELATILDLQSLKISILCLCQYRSRDCEGDDSCFTWDDADKGTGDACRRVNANDIHESIVYSLAPLNRLRFKHDLRFIAKAPQPVPRTISSMPRRPESYRDHLPSFSNEQCQKPACLSFVSSFECFSAALSGNRTPVPFTTNQCEWLSLRKMATELVSQEGKEKMEYALSDAWEALDSGSEEYMRSVVKTARATVAQLSFFSLNSNTLGRDINFRKLEASRTEQRDIWAGFAFIERGNEQRWEAAGYIPILASVYQRFEDQIQSSSSLASHFLLHLYE
ncbi:MAG: hypothetical protein L6R41_001974 [Letrouitia leprolyta]|nr:MAG: hypothetical protein L6R41_001974 [Letrouitia leprolyta]